MGVVSFDRGQPTDVPRMRIGVTIRKRSVAMMGQNRSEAVLKILPIL
jgi:hypothetical protein